MFYPNEDIRALIKKAESTKPEPSAKGNENFVRQVDAGHPIGIERKTGLPTSIYTVVTDANGNLVTAHPGKP